MKFLRVALVVGIAVVAIVVTALKLFDLTQTWNRDKVGVFIATQDIGPDSKLGFHNVASKQMPRCRVPKMAVHESQRLSGMTVVDAIKKGDVLALDNLEKVSAREPSNGCHVMVVPVLDERGAWEIKPGQTVDLWRIVDDGSDVENVMSGMMVFATNRTRGQHVGETYLPMLHVSLEVETAKADFLVQALNRPSLLIVRPSLDTPGIKSDHSCGVKANSTKNNLSPSASTP